MNETNQWKLGLFVFSSVSLIVLALIVLGAGNLRRDVRKAMTYFDESVQGLDVNSPVKARGVTIGTVASIRIAPDRRHVEVHFDLFEDALERLGSSETGRNVAPVDSEEVEAGMRVQLASAGITGLKFLQLDYFDPLANPVPTYDFPVPWNYMPSASSTLKDLEDGLRNSILRLPPALDEASRLMSTVSDKLDEVDVEGLSGRAKALLDEVQVIAEVANREDIGRRLAEAVDATRDAAKAVQGLVAGMETEDGALARTVDSLERVTRSLERAVDEAAIAATSSTLRRTTESYGALADEGNRLLVDLRQDLDALGETLEALRALAVYLERDPGALLRGRTQEEPVGTEPPR